MSCGNLPLRDRDGGVRWGFVLRLPPVVAMSSYELVEWLGPTLQRYATAP